MNNHRSKNISNDLGIKYTICTSGNHLKSSAEYPNHQVVQDHLVSRNYATVSVYSRQPRERWKR